MYSTEKANERLDQIRDRLKAKGKPVSITRLTAEESLAWRGKLHDAMTVEEGPGGKPQFTQLRPLRPEEESFIASERLICMCDFHYWVERYHYIVHWEENKFVRMVPNIAQRIVLSIIAGEELKGHAIKLQILKARQLGITTLMEAIAEHRTMFWPNTRAIVGSATPEKSTKMVTMVENSWNLMPWWLMPQMTVRKAGEMIEFGSLGSNLSIRHGAQKGTDVGRGETPTLAHLSEIAEWAHPEEDIDAGLMYAMHPSPTMFLALESSAGYIGDWWHMQWKENKANWGTETPARLIPIFLPWFIGKDIYPTATDVIQHPRPKTWLPAELTRQHARRASEYVRNTKVLRDQLGEDWEMSLEQQWYWEYRRAHYKATKELNIFLREMPANDIEAFNSKFSSVFDAEVIEHYGVAAKDPIRIYALDGPADEIRPELKPDYRQKDPNIKPITIDKKWTLVPLKKEGYPNAYNPEGKIFIWELPESDCTYGLGVDTSKGIGQDRSVAEVLRKATVDKVPRQVAEFAHSYISANDLPPWIHCLARLYSVKHSGEIAQPKLAIETNNGGDAAQLAMRKLGWYNFHNWVRLDKKIINEGKANFIGFVMVEWARDLVVGGMLKALKDFMIDIDSPWLIEEMASLEKNEEKARIEAGGREAHDDRFMAMGMILASMHALDWESLRSPFGQSRVMALEIDTGEPKKEELPRQATPKNWTEAALKSEAEGEVPLKWKEGGYGQGEWQDTAPWMDIPQYPGT